VENLVGYAKTDLMIPGVDTSGDPFPSVAAANAAAVVWCREVNGVEHSEIRAVPAERLIVERELLATLPSLRPSLGRSVTRKVDRLSCVRFASARYPVPTRLIGAKVTLRVDADRSVTISDPTGVVVCEHLLVAPGEASVRDEAAAAHGYSRAAFYLVLASFSQAGMSGLLDEPRGRLGPVKLHPEIVAFIREAATGPAELVGQVADRFGVQLHRRTIERVRAR
jgi:hypothetical protein